MSVTFGKPNFNGSFKKTKLYKLGTKKDSDRVMVIRIAPPFGDAAESGTWRRFVKQHWGYYIKGADDTGKGLPIPFLCVEETDRNGNVIVQCPECQERLKYEAQKDKKVAELEKLNKTEDEIKTATAHLTSWLKEHNLDKSWYVVAKDLSGEWGHAVIKYKAMKILMEKINKLQAEEQIDPLSPEKGVWWKFTRSGDAYNEVVDVPDQYKEKVEVTIEGKIEKLERPKFDALLQSDLDQLATVQPLSAVGRVLTRDQIEMIVQSGGDETTLRTVTKIPAKSQATSKPTPATAAPTPAPAQETAAPAEEDDEVAKLQAQLAAAQKAKAAKAAPAPAASTPTKPPAELTPAIKAALAKENMEDFLKQFQPES